MSWEITLLYFLAEILYDLDGGKFQTFDCSHEISPNLYFDMLLVLKVHKISPKKYRRVMSHDIED